MDQRPKNVRAFHPTDPAYGTLNYDIGALNKRQIRRLNSRKGIERNENELYLGAHPEIKGFISILLRYVLHKQPSMDLHETIGDFFNRPRHQILVDLLQYLLQTEEPFSLGDGFQMLTNCCP
ncbi:uncharacterized protein LOC108627110 [Ceratina calcarata]|uniref:Uncharacterized protein LOC108627110 n=1 Tax=Ceratina calcarata TaxID=156304 RepID=A0AAJ7S4D5_9HYME|nr:uncharacterized protein LOC108627110 [Ceratina calcarata]XP_026671127.1 uncharacterized protein LOC108627110 [Ceratina calcarata]